MIRIGRLRPHPPRIWKSISGVFRAAERDQQPASVAEAEEIVRSAVRDTVKRHLIGDVPIGAFLSSGVDSTTLVGIASELLYYCEKGVDG